MQKRLNLLPTVWCLLLAGLGLALTACQTDTESETTSEAVVEVTNTAESVAAATWTPIPAVNLSSPTAAPTLPPPATSTALPTSTLPAATDTPEATATEEVTATPSASPTRPPSLPQATRPPATQPPAPVGTVDPATLGGNLLPNASFEEGHYDQEGMQIPNSWRVEYDQGNTGFGNQVWDVYVRPEMRVMPAAVLPAAEHSLYIFDGSTTVKAFKDAGAVSLRLLTDVNLQPGIYVLEAQFYSDVFEAYENDQKIPPSDPSAAEVRLIGGGGGTNWLGQNFGRKNVVTYTFTLNTAQTTAVGIGLRGRYAIANNGWFLDNFSLRRVQ